MAWNHFSFLLFPRHLFQRWRESWRENIRNNYMLFLTWCSFINKADILFQNMKTFTITNPLYTPYKVSTQSSHSAYIPNCKTTAWLLTWKPVRNHKLCHEQIIRLSHTFSVERWHSHCFFPVQSSTCERLHRMSKRAHLCQRSDGKRPRLSRRVSAALLSSPPLPPRRLEALLLEALLLFSPPCPCRATEDAFHLKCVT